MLDVPSMQESIRPDDEAETRRKFNQKAHA